MTREQVIYQNHNGSLLIVANNKIYDAELYLNDNIHPGGNIFKTIVERYGEDGIDASKDYWFHAPRGRKVWNQYHVANIDAGECTCTLM